MAKIISGQAGAFKIYPRGFLGTVQSPTIEKTTSGQQSENIGRLHFDVTMFDANKSARITANMVIDNLYREAVRRGSTPFDLREKVYIAALRAFGTHSFYDWYRVQYESPAFGLTNRRFLDDTFKFIQTGRRDLPLSNWISMVKADEVNPGTREFDQYAVSFFGCTNPSEQPTYSASLPEILQQWLSKEGGFNDFLGTLFILFGVSD
jgi:hypothetical protein